MAHLVKVGFIGTGGIATRQAQRLADTAGVKIVAGCDVNPAALNKFADKYAVQGRYADYRKMLRSEELDAVSVCTPNYLHKDPTIAALKAGKHVMVEKPMAMNVREAQAMVDAAKKSKGKLTIGFQYRLSPAAQTLKRFIDAGQLGKVLFARCQCLRRRGIPSWGVFGRKELQGGGPLIDLGVHVMECAHYLMGEPRPVAASAQTFTYLGNKPPAAEAPWGPWDWKTYTVEDLAIGLIRFDNGAVMSVEASFVAYLEKDIFNVHLMGDKGGCVLDPPTVFKDEAGTMVNVQPAHVGKWQAMDQKMDDWIASVRGERPSRCPGVAGLVIQKMLDALYRSAELGREVAIK
jgi:predicted dehydrogenase